MSLLGSRCAALAAAGQLAATKAIGSLWDQISGCGQGCTGLLQASGLFVSLPFTLWQRSFPCHWMCCGPDTLLWFASAVFRRADMIGIDGHVSFLHQKKKKKKKIRWHWDKGGMVGEYEHQHLLGDMHPAQKAEPEA